MIERFITSTSLSSIPNSIQIHREWRRSFSLSLVPVNLTHTGPTTRSLVRANWVVSVPVLVYGICFVFVFLTVVNVFVVAPCFFLPGRNKNCIVTAVVGMKLSQLSSLAGAPSTHAQLRSQSRVI